jgi:hypothetical protein
MSDRHAERELEIFGRFLSARGMSGHTISIEKRQPPEPDILVRHVDGSVVAFELGEVLDQTYADTRSRSRDTRAALGTFFEGLPQEPKEQFQQKYHNALLFFRFSPRISLNRRRGVIRRVFEKLLAFNGDVTGEVLDGDPDLFPVLRSIRVARGRFTGPLFDVPSGGWVGDPTSLLIKKKLLKRYATPHPRELLVYHDINPMFPGEVWRARLFEALEAQPKPLPFQRIWVFDCKKNEVAFHYAGA